MKLDFKKQIFLNLEIRSCAKTRCDDTAFLIGTFIPYIGTGKHTIYKWTATDLNGHLRKHNHCNCINKLPSFSPQFIKTLKSIPVLILEHALQVRRVRF